MKGGLRFILNKLAQCWKYGRACSRKRGFNDFLKDVISKNYFKQKSFNKQTEMAPSEEHLAKYNDHANIDFGIMSNTS